MRPVVPPQTLPPPLNVLQYHTCLGGGGGPLGLISNLGQDSKSIILNTKGQVFYPSLM